MFSRALSTLLQLLWFYVRLIGEKKHSIIAKIKARLSRLISNERFRTS